MLRDGSDYVKAVRDCWFCNLDGCTACDTVKKNIPVGDFPVFIIVTPYYNLTCCKIYVANYFSHTISVINGFTDKVAVAVIFKINPSFSGKIKCNNTIYATNPCIYVDSGTKYTAQT